jgi:Family of unknown function (DUF6220)
VISGDKMPDKEHAMRKLYLGLSVLLLIAVLAQFYFAAMGAFTKPQHDSAYALHDITGMMIIPLLSVLATIAAAVARAPGRLIGLTILPVGLVVVQVLIVTVGRAVSGGEDAATTTGGLIILGLHAINGLAIMAVAGIVLRQARLFATAPRPAAAVVATPAA